MPKLSPREYGEYLASLEPEITDEQALAAARILVTCDDRHHALIPVQK